MKTETKMIILRMLATYYVPEYRYFKRYHFHIDGFKLKACELAETMASEGMTRRKIAETFNIGLRTAKRQVRDGQLYKLGELKADTCPQLMILTDHAKDCWIIKDILDSGISSEKISKILQIPQNTIRKMESEAVIIKSSNIILE